MTKQALAHQGPFHVGTWLLRWVGGAAKSFLPDANGVCPQVGRPRGPLDALKGLGAWVPVPRAGLGLSTAQGEPLHSEFHCGSEDDSSEDIVCLSCGGARPWASTAREPGLRDRLWATPPGSQMGWGACLRWHICQLGQPVGLMGGTDAQPVAEGPQRPCPAASSGRWTSDQNPAAAGA